MKTTHKYLVRVLVAIVLVAGTICLARADDDEIGPQGPQGIQGVVGPIGPKGAMGANGANGVTGAKGVAGNTGTTGAQGVAGTSANMSTDMSLGIGFRIADEKYASVVVYDKYSLRDTHNNEVGTMIMFKIGTSYEEREIAKLKKLLGVR